MGYVLRDTEHEAIFFLYSVLDQADWLASAAGVTEVGYGPSAPTTTLIIRGIISTDSYFWAPDGTIERLGGPATEPDGRPTLAITPGEAFARAVPLEDH